MDLDDRLNKIDTRIDGLTARMVAVEKDLAVIKSNYATRADLLEVKNSLIMWVVSTFLLSQILPYVLKQLGH